jgi:REP element-mobilizing transposase RayT
MVAFFNFVEKMMSSKSYFNGLSGGRKSMRLKNHDYGSMGYYFITMCCQNRLRWMGEVVDGKMKLNEIGMIIFEEWLSTEQKRGNVKLHEFVVMPDHFHGLIEISHSVKKAINHEKFYSPKNTIGSIVRGFKSSTTVQLYEYISSHELHWRRGELIFAPNTKGKEFAPNDSDKRFTSDESVRKLVRDESAIGRGELIFAPNTTGMEFVPNEQEMKYALHDSEMNSALHDSEIKSVPNNSEHGSTSDELEKNCAPFKLWQRGYYDRFIRTQDELNAIKNYIKANPSRWAGKMNEISL